MLSRGSIVVSLAGRDKGRMMAVYEIIDSEYVLVVDGDLRKIERPKKKKCKHLKKTNRAEIEITTNRQLRVSLGGEAIG